MKNLPDCRLDLEVPIRRDKLLLEIIIYFFLQHNEYCITVQQYIYIPTDNWS